MHPVSPCTGGSGSLRYLFCPSVSIERPKRCRSQTVCCAVYISTLNQHVSDSTTSMEMAVSQEVSSFDTTGAMDSTYPQASCTVAYVVGSLCRRTHWYSQTSLLLLQGKNADAQALYLRCISILEKALGHDHHQLAPVLHNLAGMYREQVRGVISQFCDVLLSCDNWAR